MSRIGVKLSKGFYGKVFGNSFLLITKKKYLYLNYNAWFYTYLYKFIKTIELTLKEAPTKAFFSS